MVIDGVSAIALILIASFGIDRILTGLFFLLDFIKPWTRLFPNPEEVEEKALQIRAERKRKLLYFVLAGILGGVVLAYFGEVRIFRALGFNQTNAILDSVMTGLILIAGADRVAELLKLHGMPGAKGEPKSTSQPIEVTGRLILEEGYIKKTEN